MAIVKIHFRKNAKRVISYVLKDLNEDDVPTAHRTEVHSAVEDFRATQELHKMKGDNECIHVVQSWHKKERDMLSPTEFNELGKTLASQYFPGHEFIVVTHTGTEHIHNHIVVNTVGIDTGKKIEPKKRHLYKLRDLSDEIIAEKGLSIVNGAAKEREARMPYKVQQMMRFNKHSWLLDTKQISDAVRQFVTSYDDYADHLKIFGVTVQIEPKNITYFYPGRSKGKRGSKLGKPYDKPGLEKTFRENDEKFRANPHLREQFEKAFGEFKQRKDLGLEIPKSIAETQKDYSAYTKRTREQVKSGQGIEANYESLIPTAFMRRAANGSIFDYCKRHNIEIEKAEDGKFRLKGRPHVSVTETSFLNSQNGNHGNLVKFVANHKSITILEAVAHINNAPTLLLLEDYYGKVKAHYKSFYVPKGNEENGSKALGELGKLLKSQGTSPKVANKLLLGERAQVSKDGVIRLFPENDSSGCFEFTPNAQGQFSKSKKGEFKRPFFSSHSKSKKSIVFTDPFTLMQKRDLRLFSKSKTHNVLGLMEPNAESVDHFLVREPSTKKLEIVFSGKNPSKTELDFFNILKKRYQPFGISVEVVSFENALGKEGPDLSL